METILISVCFLLAYGLLQLAETWIGRLVSKEPPLVRPRVPIIGHIVGVMQHGVSYLKMLREKTSLPIFTMFLASQKVYVVTSPALISQINRRQKVIDGDSHFLAAALGGLFGLEGDDLAEVLRNPGESGSLRRDTKAIEHGMMERGMSSLNEIFTTVMSDISEQFNTMSRKGPACISLRSWLEESFTLSTAHTVFGPDNPFSRNSYLVNDFWEFASQVKGLAMSKFPSITAAGPEKARRRLTQAFRECAEDGSFATKEGNEIVRQISGVARKHNRGAEYLTHYFFAFFSAFVLNTVPTSFWVIGHIVENQDLRTRIQAEVAEVVQSTNEPDVDHPKLTVNPAAIREKCPLLVSTFNEVLRYVGSSISTSVVRDDVYIDDDRYLLTKGAWVQISATAVHVDPEIWGSDAARFNPERFLRPFKVHPSANRTFGGGSTLCPGRHLAADEILALTAMALHTFHVRFEADTQLPRRDEANLLPIMKPTADVRLELARRQGMEHVLWEYPK